MKGGIGIESLHVKVAFHSLADAKGPLCEDFSDNMTMNVGQASVCAVVIIRDSFMVETQEMQNGCKKIVSAADILHRSAAKIVRAPIAHPPFNSSPHHPAGESIRIVVAPLGCRLASRHAAKLGCPQHENILQHSALLEVMEQCRGWLIKYGAMPFVVGLQGLMSIPVQQPIHGRRTGRAV